MPNQKEQKDLTERLDRLERQNRNLKRGLCGAFVVAVLFSIGGAVPLESDAAFRTMKAQRLSIVDSNGKDRLILALDDGEPTMSMLNHDGLQQVYLGINENWNDSAYLSVSTWFDDGTVDKQAVLVATRSRQSAGVREKILPGNSQLLLCDLARKQPTDANRHLVRLSSGRLDELEPYFEIRELSEIRDDELNFELLMAAPTDAGRRFMLDTTPEKTTISGVEVVD